MKKHQSIGYGYNFQKAKNAGALGASEYQDVKAAGEWLAAHQGINNKRVDD